MDSSIDLPALFTRIAAGGKDASFALKDLYDAYARRLLGLMRSKGFSLEEAEEIVQESFLKLYQAGSSLESVDSPKAYLYRIVHNASTDYLRRKKRSSAEIGTEPAELAEAVDANVPDSGSYDGFVDCFEAAFGSFEEDAPDRAYVVRLAIIEGMSGQELADAIGRSYGAAREFLSQTRKKFQQLLESMCGDYLSEGAR